MRGLYSGMVIERRDIIIKVINCDEEDVGFILGAQRVGRREYKDSKKS